MNIDKTKVYLRKNQECFKLIIPKNVEEKIKCACLHLPDTEWSGVLFYKHKGTFKDNLTLTCVNFIILDIGTASRTEFETTPKVASFMVDNNLMNCHQGLIHSHNNFSTFFSGTDTETLKSEGALTNHFLSLIVNDAGIYSAAITKKFKYTGTIKYNIETEAYGKKITQYSTQPVKEFYIVEYWPIKVIETPYNPIRQNTFSELNELAELKEKEERAAIIKTYPSYNNYGDYGDSFYEAYKGKSKNNKEDSLFDNEED